MKRLILSLFLASIAFVNLAYAQEDDATRLKLAKNIKKDIEKSVRKSGLNGFCDVFIETDHIGKYAVVKSVKTAGSNKFCILVKKTVNKRKKYKYEQMEKIIRLHIEQI